jgi:hypothetical protein
MRFVLGMHLVALLCAASASAQPRVATLRFLGPQGGRLHGNLVQNLAESGAVELVPERELERAQRSNRRLRNESSYAALASAVDASFVVEGRVSRLRRGWSLTVRVRDAEGAIVGSESWGGRTVGSLSAVRRNGYDRLGAYFQTARPRSNARGTGARQVRRPVVRTGTQRTGTPTVQRTGTPWYATPEPEPEVNASSGDGSRPWYAGEAPPEEEEEEEEDEPDTDSAGRRRWDAFSAALIGGVERRFMSAEARVRNECGMEGGVYTGRSCRDPSRNGEVLAEERSYDHAGLGHGQIGVTAEVYPGAFADDQPFPYLGAYVLVRYGILLETETCAARSRAFDVCTVDDVFRVPTTEYELGIGLRLRVGFDDERYGGAAIFDLGYGRLHFGFNLNALAEVEPQSVIPPITYDYVNLGAALRYGIVPVYFIAAARFGYRYSFGVGSDAQNVWGVSTGGSHGLVAGVDLTTEMPYIAEGIFLRLGVEYIRLMTTFRGQVACFEGSACTDDGPWEAWPYGADLQDVTGGIQGTVADNYFRVAFELGYALH